MKLSEVIAGWFERHPDDPVPLYELEIWGDRVAQLEVENKKLKGWMRDAGLDELLDNPDALLTGGGDEAD